MSGIIVLLYVFLKNRGIHWAIAWGTTFVFATLSIHHENIFWVSGQSSLLSAFFFLISMVLLQKLEHETGKKIILKLFLYGSVFCSMLSYDGMIVAPVLLFGMSFFLSKKWKHTLPLFFLIPMYWGLRSYSGAVTPSGDYGYKLTTFFVNSIGNTIGYIGGIFIGPRMLEYISLVRTVLKNFLPQVSAGAGILLLGITYVGYRMRQKIYVYKDILIFILLAFLSSLSYMGLGNASERYAFIPSLFIIIAVGLAFSTWIKQTKGFVAPVFFALCVLAVSWWNIQDVKRLEEDWRKASEIAESTLLAIKKEAYPPKMDVSFFFINPPIRYGRAWIFPTGLHDALWHMFRENLYAVHTVPSIKEGYESSAYRGMRYVYVFDNYVLKYGFIKTIEVPHEE